MALDTARAKSLFLAAADIVDPADRATYLDRECGGDAELRARVEELLRANDAVPLPPLPAEDAIRPPGSPDATQDYHDPSARVGQVIAGRYKLLEEIGEGGMGTVFMAQQAAPVKRAVAVKIVKPGMNSKAVLARFEAERQALALMDHPNIARVLDAGTTESGRPFFVMELVKGIPITQYCDQHKLTVRQRLELFVPVCQALQHAHQKGVIHRDLKPSNVLVALYDDRPVPKVIDFGVAKATGQSLTDKTLMTGFGVVVGTPEYMSPEQANLNNLDIDTRSDVYSLGVLLYELLTGTTPVDRKSLGKAAVLEVLRIVREYEAPRPSTKLSSSDALPSIATNRNIEPARLTRLMEGELDWILLKALEKDRSRRYESANGFARDIQHFLAGEPVQAAPPSTSYRLKKFLKRNKRQVTAAALILLALTAGTVVSSFFAADSYRQARLAREQAEIARENEIKARSEKERADEKAAEADRNAKRADQSAAQATAARRDAEQKADAEGRAKALAEGRLYASRILLARAVLDQGQFGQVSRALQNAAGQQRGWEWNYLDAIRDASCRTLDKSFYCQDLYYVLDGKALIGVRDFDAQLIDPKTAKVLGEEGSSYGLTAARVVSDPFPNFALSPDRKTVAIGSISKGTVIWNLATNKSLVAGPIAAPGEHRPLTVGVNFSGDGRRVVASDGKTVRVQDALTGKTIEQFDVDTDSVWSVAFSPDGRFVACGCEDHTARVIALETKKEVFRSKKHLNPVTFVAFAPDGKRLISWSSFDNPKLWDIATGTQMLKLSSYPTACVALSPDGKQAAAATFGADNAMHLWDTTSGEETRVLRGHRGFINRVVWSLDSKQLASGGCDKVVKLWDAGTGKLLRNLPGQASDIQALCFSCDGRELVTAAGCVKVFDLMDRPNPQSLYSRPGIITALRFLDNRTLLAAGLDFEWIENKQRRSDEGIVDLWDTDSGKLMHTLRGHAAAVSCMALAGEGRCLATRSEDGMVKVWDLSAAALAKLNGPADAGSAELHNRPDPLLRRTVGKPAETRSRFPLDLRMASTAVALTPDARRVFAGTNGEQIEVWDVAEGRELQTLSPPTNDLAERRREAPGKADGNLCLPITMLGVMDGGRLLAAFACDDGILNCPRGSIRVWDTATYQPKLTARIANRLGQAAVSPDGRWLVWGGLSEGVWGDYPRGAAKLIR